MKKISLVRITLTSVVFLFSFSSLAGTANYLCKTSGRGSNKTAALQIKKPLIGKAALVFYPYGLSDKKSALKSAISDLRDGDQAQFSNYKMFEKFETIILASSKHTVYVEDRALSNEKSVRVSYIVDSNNLIGTAHSRLRYDFDCELR